MWALPGTTIKPVFLQIWADDAAGKDCTLTAKTRRGCADRCVRRCYSVIFLLLLQEMAARIPMVVMRKYVPSYFMSNNQCFCRRIHEHLRITTGLFCPTLYVSKQNNGRLSAIGVSQLALRSGNVGRMMSEKALLSKKVKRGNGLWVDLCFVSVAWF